MALNYCKKNHESLEAVYPHIRFAFQVADASRFAATDAHFYLDEFIDYYRINPENCNPAQFWNDYCSIQRHNRDNHYPDCPQLKKEEQ